MHQVIVLLIVTDKIVMVIAPYHSIGADTKLFLFGGNGIGLSVKTALAIDKINTSARLNSSADDVYIIIDFFIEALMSFFDIDLSFKHHRLRCTAEGTYLFDKLLGLCGEYIDNDFENTRVGFFSNLTFSIKRFLKSFALPVNILCE